MGLLTTSTPARPLRLPGLLTTSLSLSYCHDYCTGEAVVDVVSSCRALEHLSLRNCYRRGSIRIASETLRILEIVGCEAAMKVRVTAPALESIAIHDMYFSWLTAFDVVFDFQDGIPALADVYFSQICFWNNFEGTYYGILLSFAQHAPVWTLSSYGYLLRLRLDTTNNIQELQLLMPSEDDYHHLEHFAGFFQENELPLLDRLFIRFFDHDTDESDANAAATLAGEVVDGGSELEIVNREGFVLDSLSFFKLLNFRGTMLELQVLAFVLKRAPALEHLVLVVSVGGEEATGAPGPPGGGEHLELIHRHVSAMRKASPHARLTVCPPSQDRSRNPVHTRFYLENVRDDLVAPDTEEMEDGDGEDPSPARPSRVRRPILDQMRV